nr:EAL domain-containing protein [uncultured Cohaesibacter sp.]
MQRLGAVFIAICMVAISLSVGVMLHFKFGLSITEASPFSFGMLLALLLVHYQISRVRDRMMLDEQMDDLTRLKLALTKEVQDVREMARELDSTVSGRLEKEVEPILAELDVIGTLVKQLAESCADLDERVQQGEGHVAEVNAKLMAATSSVKELEEHLRANARSLAAKYDKPVQAPARPEAQPVAPAYAAPERSYQEPAEPEPVEQEPQFRSYEQEQLAPVASPTRSVNDAVAGPFTEKKEQPVSPEDEAKVRRALALGRIELYMQPIVALPMRKPQFYEALTRLKTDEDEAITPDIFLPVCRQNGFLPMLDRLAVNEAFRLLRRLSDRGHPVELFCNLALESLADSDFFALMRDLFDQNRDLAPYVILEFSQADLRKFGLMEEETLKLLSSMGFRFSVDRVTNLAAGFDEFAQKGVKFAKIAAPILTHRDAGRGLDIHPADFSRLLSRKGMDLIVTHVESESDLVSLIDYNVHLAQGDHFAPAKALKGNPVGARGNEQAGTVSQQQQAAALSRTPMRPSQFSRMSGGAGEPAANRASPVDRLSQFPEQSRLQAPASPSARAATPPPMPSGMAPQRAPERPSRPASPSSEPQARNNGAERTLGENPRVAEALRAMASEDTNNSETRDHFRAVLAEAAGLINPGEASGQAGGGAAPAVRAASRDRMQPQRSVGQSGRLPAADEFGLKTGTDRGQFIEVS